MLQTFSQRPSEGGSWCGRPIGVKFRRKNRRFPVGAGVDLSRVGFYETRREAESSRRGGGRVVRGGDACVALTGGGMRAQGRTRATHNTRRPHSTPHLSRPYGKPLHFLVFPVLFSSLDADGGWTEAKIEGKIDALHK